MTNEERLIQLRQLGYNERDAGFLLQAALHSGAFVMRQYSTYTSIKPGGTTDHFVSKALANRHIRSYPTKNRSLIYQICKPVFDAVGEVDNRNRRIKQPYLTRLRLMALDFVLAHQGRTYHSTESDKVAFFSALPVEILPRHAYKSNLGLPPTTRYFIEKFPIYTRGTGAGFAFMCESSIPTFETFLARYLPLMAALPEAELVYVSTAPAMIDAAHQVFSRRTEGYASIDFVDFELEFRERSELESQVVALTPAGMEIEKLRKLRQLRNSRAARFYDTWKQNGLHGLADSLKRLAVVPGAKPPQFAPCLLPEVYQFL
jgi:hypothetical protein